MVYGWVTKLSESPSVSGFQWMSELVWVSAVQMSLVEPSKSEARLEVGSYT